MMKNLFLLKNLNFNLNFLDSIPSRKRDFYTFDSSDEKIIQEISDKGIGGDEGVNMKKDIEEDIEKDIKKGIKKVVEQIIKEIVEEIDMKKDIGDSSKFRRSGRDRK
jgi:hypothetical protein